ncbi:MAG: ATP synthase subunit c [Firmicutes bacterium ADurb.Bin419]|nr:MAG: ATP synthase subunit c [Firmicutes bacterium ADurb.Bin419]
MGNTAFAISLALLGCVTAGLGISFATGKAVDAVARQPEAGTKIQNVMLLGAALAEATAIYGFVIALLMILLK